MEIYLIAVGFTAWALALSYLDRSPRDRLKNSWALYAAFFAVGVLSWVKSPLYSVLWVFGYFAFLVAKQEWREFRSPHLYVALVFGTLLGASWYLAILGIDRDRFVADYIVRETLSKQGGNGGAPWQLWLSALSFSIPFVLLTFGSLFCAKLDSGRRLWFFALAAGAPAAVFFSVYPYRVNTYLYVLVPILAILAAYFEEVRPRVAALVSRIGAVTMILVTGYFVWLGLRIDLTTGWRLGAVSLVGTICVASWMGTLFRPKLGVWAAVIFVAWLHSLGVTLGERDIAGLREFVSVNSHRQLAILDPDRNIWHEVGLLSVALGKPVARISSAQDVLDVLDAGNAVILSEDQASSILPEVRKLLDDEDDGREVLSTPWNRFPTRKSLEVRQLIRAKTRLELNRKFQILTLPPPSDWMMPEGGV
ncbi:hypothetical protein EBZ37_02175 [bacterium]|nr:hypothetical protein [bacterium]